MLGRWDVLAVAAFMYAMEFVADKIPYVDSTWDVISTAIRPTVGAVIGVLLAGDADTLDQAVSGTVGGGTALASHLVKAGSRLAINASPEPVTNIARQHRRGRRGAGVVWFAIEHPRAAAAVAAACSWPSAWWSSTSSAKLIRRGWRRYRNRGVRHSQPLHEPRRRHRRRFRRPGLGGPAGQARPRGHPAGTAARARRRARAGRRRGLRLGRRRYLDAGARRRP